MKLELRKIDIQDLDKLVEYAGDAEVANNLTDRFPHPYTTKHGLEFIEFANSDSPEIIRAIIVDGEFSGTIGIHPQSDVFRKNAELGYWLARQYWGKGIMTKAVSRMVDFGFSNLNIDRIFARTFGRNIPSRKVLEKAGFILEAEFKSTIYKNGRYEDELIYTVRRASYLKR